MDYTKVVHRKLTVGRNINEWSIRPVFRAVALCSWAHRSSRGLGAFHRWAYRKAGPAIWKRHWLVGWGGGCRRRWQELNDLQNLAGICQSLWRNKSGDESIQSRDLGWGGRRIRRQYCLVLSCDVRLLRGELNQSACLRPRWWRVCIAYSRHGIWVGGIDIYRNTGRLITNEAVEALRE